MRFTSLTLRNFRNYPSLSLKPCPGTTVLFGRNGAGKTNLLEAMHLLAVGRSHRTSQDREMIARGAPAAIAGCETLREDGRHAVEVRLYAAEKPQKRVLLHGKPATRVGDLMGHVTCVMFSPEDLRIVRDGPAARRRFLDMQLSQIRPAYLLALRRYLAALEHRNALLKSARFASARALSEELDAWDEQLAQTAAPVVSNRRWFVSALETHASALYATISEDPTETFHIAYTGAAATADDVQRTMLDGLRRTRAADQHNLFTCFGPHRDDFSMSLAGRELHAFGSQGQTRTAVLSLKLGEVSLIADTLGEPPALLLDDVFSELDARRRNALLHAAAQVQTFISCTDVSDAAGAKPEVFLEVTQGDDGTAQVQARDG